MIRRHPFPGPGPRHPRARRHHREKLDLLRKADAVYLDEIDKAGLYDKIWQAFAVLLPVKTVGVMGDGRTYDYVCALRAVTSTDGMTADFYPFEPAFLGRVATRIINEVRGINRVVYDFTSQAAGDDRVGVSNILGLLFLQEIRQRALHRQHLRSRFHGLLRAWQWKSNLGSRSGTPP